MKKVSRNQLIASGLIKPSRVIRVSQRAVAERHAHSREPHKATLLMRQAIAAREVL